MGIALAGLMLPGLAALLAAPESAALPIAWLAAGLGVALHARLPPPSEESTEAVLLAALAAM